LPEIYFVVSILRSLPLLVLMALKAQQARKVLKASKVK